LEKNASGGHLESVGGIGTVSQEQLHHGKVATSTGQGDHRVVIVGRGSVHVSTYTAGRVRAELEQLIDK